MASVRMVGQQQSWPETSGPSASRLPPFPLDQWFSAGETLSSRASGNVWRHVWLLQLGSGCSWHRVVGSQGAAKPPAMHWLVPHSKELSAFTGQ